MPLNSWNMPSFRVIGSIWGHLIEVDERTLKEISFEKGRLLLANENPNRIKGKIRLVVDGINYTVRVEEEESFKTISSSKQFYSSGSRRVEEDDVDKSKNDMDNNRTEKRNSVDDLAREDDLLLLF
ncbi:hypothetical protein RHMOL_Rhmol08G0158100 [Rhododendron molle]|uniref:Uncharacterized protein n=1 Tax=Rhododendron molle TaxID=49168 RepID=A0ACC0MNR4_RHOML|nr:hypothetical protein RHMOL_Rhmol08G0158100 [Rhododendron molle]